MTKKSAFFQLFCVLALCLAATSPAAANALTDEQIKSLITDKTVTVKSLTGKSKGETSRLYFHANGRTLIKEKSAVGGKWEARKAENGEAGTLCVTWTTIDREETCFFIVKTEKGIFKQKNPRRIFGDKLEVWTGFADGRQF